MAAHGAGELARRDDVVGTEPASLALLMGVAGADDHAGARHVAHEPGDGRQAQRPGAEDGDDRFVGGADRLSASRHEGGVDAGGEWFDEHGPLLGHVADAVQLALVGHELGRPAAARRRAEAGLDARLEISGDEVSVVVAVARRRSVERRCEAACGVAEHRFEHDARAVVELADDLVAGHEGERHDVVEVRGGVAFDHRQVGAADAGQVRADTVPPGAGQVGRVDAAVLERRDPYRRRRAQRRGDTRQPEPGHVAPHLERSHRAGTSNWASTVSVSETADAQMPGRDWGRPDWGRGRGSSEDLATLALGHHRSHGERSAAAAGGLRPLLDEPAALAGDGGKARLGVDGDREADRLEHR